MSKRILLVDDEPQLLFSVKEFLCRVGYDIAAAESGAEALEMVIDAPPDLIISDILMEEMDGFEFQRRVSALTGSGIPFIFLTARGELQSRLEGLRAGADDYVIKPFEPEELEARIASIFHRAEQIRREERRQVETLRNRILSEVSSRLRVPVTSLMAHMNLLLSERFGTDQAKQSRYLKSVAEDANTLAELIDDLSWAASDDLGSLSLKREPIRVAPVVRSAAANAARLANEKDVNLQISCGGLLSGNLDGSAMTRALAGLLESAVTLSPARSEVHIEARRAGEGGLEFVITDGGYLASAEQSGEVDSLSGALDLARHVVRGHGGQFAMREDEEGKHSLVIWVPGRVTKHIGKHK